MKNLIRLTIISFLISVSACKEKICYHCQNYSTNESKYIGDDVKSCADSETDAFNESYKQVPSSSDTSAIIKCAKEE